MLKKTGAWGVKEPREPSGTGRKERERRVPEKRSKNAQTETETNLTGNGIRLYLIPPARSATCHWSIWAAGAYGSVRSLPCVYYSMARSLRRLCQHGRMQLSRASSSFRSVTEHQRNGSTFVAATAITRRRPPSRQRAARMPKDGRGGDAEGKAAAIPPFRDPVPPRTSSFRRQRTRTATHT